MTGFYIVIGVLVALGMAFVLPALVRQRNEEDKISRAQANVMVFRDQLKELDADLHNGAINTEQHATGRRELEKRVLEETLAAVNDITPAQPGLGRWAPVVLAVLIPVAAIGMYLKVGSPSLSDPTAASSSGKAASAEAEADPQQQGIPHDTTIESIRLLAQKLAAKLKDKPDDGASWAMLARSYTLLGRFGEAAQAYTQAEKLLPPDAQLMADHADALAMSQGQNLEGEPLAMLKRALQIDPSNLKAQTLLGTAAFNRKDYKVAVDYWQQAIKQSPPNSEFTKSIQGSLDEARALAEGRTPPAALPSIMPAEQESAAPTTPGAGQVSGQLSGQVTLSPKLADKTSPGDTLFIFARAEQGSRMPLAILSLKAGDLPANFSLDDSNAMAPGMKLSTATSVMVFARISKSGSASTHSGDLEGSTGPIKPGTQNLQINIDKIIP